jgi:uncharacterized membrane protein
MSETSPNTRLETFCDGVFAIALTLLIIDIKIPSTESINSTSDFWLALSHVGPSVFAFLLSFAVILITWVNHHSALKLVSGSSGAFIYANGLLLLSVVFLPFPTSLVGEFILTDHAAPAVVLYEAVSVTQSLAWVLLCGAALKNQMTKSENAARRMRINRRNGAYAIVVYSLLAILAFWFPLTIAIVTTLLWIFWLVFGITMKPE